MESSSLPNSEEQCTSILDLSKKRKFPQFEHGNSNLPWPKHRVLNQSDSSDHHHPQLAEIVDNENSTADVIDSGTDDTAEVESENGSNISSNIIGGTSDSKTTSQADSNTESLYSIDIIELDPSVHDLNNEKDDVAPFSLAPGGWSFEQEARKSSDKLTIDQEFEQYFAGLML